MSPTVRAHPLGDSAVVLSLGESQSRELLSRVHALARTLSGQRIEHVHDVVPSYLAVTVFYDSLRVSYEEMKRQLLSLSERADEYQTRGGESREHFIPVNYDGRDLPEVAERTGIAVDEVVRLHASHTYTVDLLGFVPGFAYLSELPPELRLPRRGEPRPRVPAGSVAIAGSYTGVYPLDTPGGWHLIGRTETLMFDPTASPPTLFKPGDSVRFVPA